MNVAHALIRYCQENGITLAPTPEGKLKVRPAKALSEELKDQLRDYKQEIIALLNQKPTPSVCSSLSHVEETSPDREYFLVRSALINMSFWMVRNRQDGKDLARETGFPALSVEDIFAKLGKNTAEIRSTLLPLFLTTRPQ